MEAEDEDLSAAMDEQVGELMDSNPELVADILATFGTASPAVTQQWVSFGLAENTAQVNAIVRTHATDTDKRDETEEDAQVDSRTVDELPSGTRVVLINQRESFYGAIGTVAGPPRSATHVPVVFDSKPGASYNVPAADLDLYRNATQVKQLLVDEEGTWTFNGVPSLVTFLQAKQHTNGRWAFTGSVALSYWARKYGVSFRHPHDIDIVVDNLLAWHNGIVKAVTGQDTRRPAGPDSSHMTVELSMGKVDIIANGKGLGEFGAGPYVVDGVPVVGLRTIGHYKQKRGKDKDLEDLRIVDRLIRLQDEDNGQ
jgi:hypothetical protein